MEELQLCCGCPHFIPDKKVPDYTFTWGKCARSEKRVHGGEVCSRPVWVDRAEAKMLQNFQKMYRQELR